MILFEPPYWYSPWICENCTFYEPPKITCEAICKREDCEKCPTLIPKKDILKKIENDEFQSLGVSVTKDELQMIKEHIEILERREPRAIKITQILWKAVEKSETILKGV